MIEDFVKKEFNKEYIVINETITLTYGGIIRLLSRFISAQKSEHADIKGSPKRDGGRFQAGVVSDTFGEKP